MDGQGGALAVLHRFHRQVAPAQPAVAAGIQAGHAGAAVVVGHHAAVAQREAAVGEQAAVELLADGNRSVVSSTDFVARSLSRVSADIKPDVAQVFEDPAQIAKLDFLLLNSRDLILRLNNDLGGGIGLAAGFSFSDGD